MQIKQTKNVAHRNTSKYCRIFIHQTQNSGPAQDNQSWRRLVQPTKYLHDISKANSKNKHIKVIGIS